MVEIREEYEAAKTAEEGQHFLNVKEIREADSS